MSEQVLDKRGWLRHCHGAKFTLPYLATQRQLLNHDSRRQFRYQSGSHHKYRDTLRTLGYIGTTQYIPGVCASSYPGEGPKLQAESVVITFADRKLY